MRGMVSGLLRRVGRHGGLISFYPSMATCRRGSFQELTARYDYVTILSFISNSKVVSGANKDDREPT